MRITFVAVVVLLSLVCNFKVRAADENVGIQIFGEKLLDNLFYRLKSVKPLAQDASETVVGSINFYVYTRKNPSVPQRIEADVESVIRNAFRPIKPTTVVIHGSTGGLDSADTQEIVAARLEYEDCNVVVVDWSNLYLTEYVDIVAAAPSIGEQIADFLVFLKQFFNVKYEGVHLVGFSIGAHIAGFAGQSLYEREEQKVQQITGLDPAGNIYNDLTDDKERLSADDAVYVEVIHTNIAQNGYKLPCGDADFYPNGGEVQPNCESSDAGCSHRRAYEFVKEMWSESNDFLSAKCSSTADMSYDSCSLVNVRMGVTTNIEGLYFLETNDNYPYSKGSFLYTFL